MSADLWAAFGDGEEALSNPWSEPSPLEDKSRLKFKTSATEKVNSNLQFDASLPEQARQLSNETQSPWDNDFLSDSINRPSATSVTVDTVWNHAHEEPSSWRSPAFHRDTIGPSSSTSPPTVPEVLWDAEQLSDKDDDFGEFQDPVKDISHGISNLTMPENVKIPIDYPSPQDYQQGLRSSLPGAKISHLERHALIYTLNSSIEGTSGPKQLRVRKESNDNTSTYAPSSGQQELIIRSPSSTVEEKWDEWSPNPTINVQFSNSTLVTPSTTILSNVSMQSNHTTSTPRSVSPQRARPIPALPPTNIPPPSILISLLSTLITTLPNQIERILQSLPATTSFNSTADRALSTAIRKCLAALRVSARIIAGRKLRWKRDTHLSQSIRIGPAPAAAGRGGMKLSSVDKNVTKREDREVIEFIRIWHAKLGAVRRALASANSKIGDAGQKLDLPVISEGMIVKVVRDEDGGVRSAKACVLCGIRREERVDKVDGLEVFDVAGEWWIEYWGHRECQAFWYQHEKYLQQR